MILMVKTKPTVLFKKKSILLIIVFLIGCFVCACGKDDSVAGETLVEDTEEVSSTEETKSAEEEAAEPVSYTHLTLPTKRIV